MYVRRKKKVITIKVTARAPFAKVNMRFTPNPAYVWEPEEIRFIFTRCSTPRLKFTDFSSDASPEFGKPRFERSHRVMIISDLDEIKSKEAIQYCLTFKDAHGVIHKPDPQIINDPTMAPRPRTA